MKAEEKPKRVVRIDFRKLGRERAKGQYLHGKRPRIEIDPRQEPKDMLDTFIHESLHYAFPQLSEDEVATKAGWITEILWSVGYRRAQL